MTSGNRSRGARGLESLREHRRLLTCSLSAATIAHHLFLCVRTLSPPLPRPQCSLCVQTMDLFVSCYGAEAGNLCLKTLPFGGLYIAGGIAAKNMAAMRKNQQFVNSFLDKGENTNMEAKRASTGQDGQAWRAPTGHSRCCSYFFSAVLLLRHHCQAACAACCSACPSISSRTRRLDSWAARSSAEEFYSQRVRQKLKQKRRRQ